MKTEKCLGENSFIVDPVTCEEEWSSFRFLPTSRYKVQQLLLESKQHRLKLVNQLISFWWLFLMLTFNLKVTINDEYRILKYIQRK